MRVTVEQLQRIADDVRALVGPRVEHDLAGRSLLHDARNLQCAINLYAAVPRDDTADDRETWRDIVDAAIALQSEARAYAQARAGGLCPCCGQRVRFDG